MANLNASTEQRPMQRYQLPDGRIVNVDATAAKGASVIDYTLEGGRITQAVIVRDIGDATCVCGHKHHQHTYVASGAERCKSFGCGCWGFEPAGPR